MKDLTPRERVQRALRREEVDKVPFTVYESKIPQCAVERRLRNMGLCIVYRTTPICRHVRPNVRWTSREYVQDGRMLRRVTYETPAGTLSGTEEPVDITTWRHERAFKTKDDYKALKFIIADSIYTENHAAIADAQDMLGEDLIVRGTAGYNLLQDLISNWMGVEIFCYEWMDNRDEILELFEVGLQKSRDIIEIAAQSPAFYCNGAGGNTTPEVIGLEVFEKYYLPTMNEAAEGLHKAGKYIGLHFDANNQLFKKCIAESKLDHIEAFTPSPDTDMSVKEAREAWPDKLLWVNFPSSMHVSTEDEIRQKTAEIIEENGGKEGLIIGITEDVPPERWQGNFLAIMETIDEVCLG